MFGTKLIPINDEVYE